MFYSEKNVADLKQKSQEIKRALEQQKFQLMEPSHGEQIAIHNIIKEYCISKKRKICGGFAWNLLISKKNIQDKFYNENLEVPDIDFYSFEPITDLYNICNLLHKKGFKYVLGDEAVHIETYCVKVNRKIFCDISYVPKNIYAKIPFIDCDRLICSHPSFMTIDYLRMASDPLVSYWRFFDCNEELQTFKRFFNLQKCYPLPYNNSPLEIEGDIPLNIKKGINLIYNHVLEKQSIVTIGYYAYNYFCYEAYYETIEIPFFECISINYKKDFFDIINILKKEFPEETITCDEYYPLFQFSGYCVEICINNLLLCRIHDDNKKCIQCQDIDAVDFAGKNKIIRNGGKIKIGSFTTVCLYFLIDVMRQRIRDNKKLEFTNYHIISHCVQARNKYLQENNKSFTDNTIFQEFGLNYIGESITPEKERMFIIEKRKTNKEPLVYRYDPKTEKEPPKFRGFRNTSGNKIIGEKNLKLGCNDFDDCGYDEETGNFDDKTHQEKINSDYFDKISINIDEKKYCAFMNKTNFKKFNISDFIIWENNCGETFKTFVEEILYYKTFAGALTDIGSDNISIICENDGEEKYGVIVTKLVKI